MFINTTFLEQVNGTEGAAVVRHSWRNNVDEFFELRLETRGGRVVEEMTRREADKLADRLGKPSHYHGGFYELSIENAEGKARDKFSVQQGAQLRQALINALAQTTP